MRGAIFAICITSFAFAIVGCIDCALANDDLQPTPNSKPRTLTNGKIVGASSSSSTRQSKQHRNIQRSSKEPSDQNGNKAKAQPWFAVDPDRAAKPSEPPSPEDKSSIPTQKWARDPVEFGYKVNGSNDLRMLPRFDINQNPSGSVGIGADPQGASGEVGVNLHF